MKLKDFFKDFYAGIYRHVPGFVPYFATLFYCEIIYFMFIIAVLYGKAAGVAAGFTAAVLLTFHIIRLFNRGVINRKIQLFLMDVHFAYSLAYLANRIFADSAISAPDMAMMAVRTVTALLELPLIIALTDEFIIKKYYDQG